jgi:hypothetical protein
MMYNTERKSIQWEFVKSLEPPRIVHMRTQEIMSKANFFAQITVRFHTQQVACHIQVCIFCRQKLSGSYSHDKGCGVKTFSILILCQERSIAVL